ncbi:MAG: hypothetical protein AB7E47_08725 [Desulfovibrionaceae bacterium]
MQSIASTALSTGLNTLTNAAGGMDWTSALAGGLSDSITSQAALRQTQKQQEYDIETAAVEAQAIEDEARYNADKSWKATQKELADLRDEQQRKRAKQTASMGKSGVLLTSGSPLAVLEGTAYMDELDTQELRQAGKDQEKDILRAGALSANKLRANTAKAYGNYDQALNLLTRGAGVYGK